MEIAANGVRPVGADVRRQRGVGLIEVLLATLILSIGLFASAVMQVRSLQSNQDSHFRGQAGALLEDMIDRMRSNPDALAAGAYDAVDTALGGGSGDCLATTCTPAQLALADIAAWRSHLVPDAGVLASLPPRADGSPARGTISRDGDGFYTATLEWQSRIDGEATDVTLSTRFLP